MRETINKKKSNFQKFKIYYKNRTPDQKIAIWSVGIAISTGFLMILGWFAEPLAQKLVDYCFIKSTITKTLPAYETPSFEYTMSPLNPSITFTMTPTNTNTPEPTVTPSITKTITLSPTSTTIPGVISKGCLNMPWEGSNLSYINTCLNLTGKGISPIDNGMIIYAEATTDEELDKTILKLPITNEMKSIKFSVELTHFKESYRGQPTLLFFGIANNNDPFLKGSFIVFDKTEIYENIHSTYVQKMEPDLYAGRRGDENYFEREVVEIEFVMNDLYIDMIKNGQYDSDYSRISTNTIEQPVFVIGIVVGPGGGILSSEIKNFTIKYED